MRYRLITFIVFGAALIGVGLWDAKNRQLAFNQELNHGWLDFCVGNSRDLIGDPNVTFVRIDEETRPLNSEGDSLTRLDYGAMLRIIDNQKPRVVAFHTTPEFDEKNQLNQTALEPLKTAAIALPRMTLGSVAESGQAPANPAENVIYPAIPAENISGDTGKVPALTRTVRSPDAQILANGDPAFTELALAPGGIGPESWTPLVAKQGDNIVPSFAVAALLNHLGKDLGAVYLQFPPAVPKPVIIIGDTVDEPIYSIPVDNGGRMKVYEDNGIAFDFSDGSDATRLLEPSEQFSLDSAIKVGRIPHVSANELAFTAADDPEFINNLLRTEKTERLRRGFESMDQYLIVVGDDREADRHIELPLTGRKISPAGLTAQTIATIQSKRFIQQWPLWLVILGVIIILALGIWLFGKSRTKVLVFGSLALLFYLAASVMLFKSTLMWAPPIIPLGLFALILVIGLILPLHVEQKVLESESSDSKADSDSLEPDEKETAAANV